MAEQLTLWDWMPDIMPGPEVGEYVTRHGAIICHIMRPGYIGKMVVFDCSTQSHEWFRCGILEAYIPYENTMRSIINVGSSAGRLLGLDMFPGLELKACPFCGREAGIRAGTGYSIMVVCSNCGARTAPTLINDTTGARIVADRWNMRANGRRWND